MKRNFTHFTVMDFAEEDSFIRWAHHGDPEAAAFWEKWVEEHPEKKSAVAEAFQILRLLQVPEKEPSRQTIEALWSRIDNATTQESASSPKPQMRLITSRKWLPYAAAATLALLVFFVFNRPAKNIVVKNGEQLTITLPDGSLVKANAGSTLSYRPGRWGKERKIRLSGEAFFEVKKGQPFTVITEQGFVEVLGTRFNVRARKNTFKVDCLSGKVRVSGGANEQQILTTGLSTGKTGDNPLSAPVALDTSLIASWREGRFFFSEASLKEVFAELELQFDISIQTTPEILDRRTTTFFERGNLDSALYKVCWPMQLEARRKGKIVIIK